MNTRNRAQGQPPTQQGYSSSAEYERGLLANLVAQRCGVLDAPEDRELLFSLQYVSHQPGGLEKLAATLIAKYPEQVVTKSMQRLGFKPGQIYSARQVREVRAEIPDGRDCYLLKGEFSELQELSIGPEMIEFENLESGRTETQFSLRYLEAKMDANERPETYPAESFAKDCLGTARQHLAKRLERLCLDPSAAIEGAWYFPNLIPTLHAHFKSLADSVQTRLAVTVITRQVFEALDYSLAADGITFINGLARIGKTFAVKAWCEQRPGLARYIQVPPTNDDISFFRRIADALGISSSLSLKGTQLRERVERTARAAKLVLVFDEAHHLISQDYRCRKRPSRISWIMNELINYGVPAALCTTPQFNTDKALVRERTGWAWEQFDGRIGHFAVLDEILSLDDLKAVTRVHLPEVNADAIFGVAKYAQESTSYVAGIEHVAKRARYIARRACREKVTTDDVVQAIKSRLPLDLNSSGLKTVGTNHEKPKRVRAELVRAVTPSNAESPLARSTKPEAVPV